MESRDWRYGWAADDPRWTDEPAGTSPWSSNGNGRPDPDQQPRNQMGTDADDSWDELLSTQRPLAITGPTQPAQAAHLAVRRGYGLLAEVVGDGSGATGTGAGTRAGRPPRPDARVRRRRRSNDDEFRRTTMEAIFGDEPRYRALLGLTAGWYALLALIYLGWVAIAGDQGSGLGSESVVASLPWLATAVALSLAVAALLRWAVVGWRALTLSFAAAVIGAGVATVAHSLAA